MPGFAEGCSLSVVSMLAANQLVDVWMKHKAPMIRTISYVDNIELLALDPEILLHGTNQFKRIMSLLELSIDDSKTYLWSTSGAFRKVFVQAGHPVKKAARET